MAYIYLASPYSHKNENIRHQRYLQVSQVVVQMLQSKIHVYSPIVHCHEIAKRFKLPKDFTFWNNYNEAMLVPATSLYILQLDGWKESKGIQGEIRIALANNIPIVQLPFPLET